MSPDPLTDYILFEKSPGARALIAPNPPVFAVHAVSDDFCLLTGFSKEAIIGNSIYSVFARRNDAALVLHTLLNGAMQQAIVQKTRQQFFIPRQLIAGTTGASGHLRIIVVPQLDREDSVQYMILSVEESGGRADEQHLNNVEKAYDLFMQAPVAVCIVSGEEFLVELANARMLQLLGRTAEIVGKSLEQALPEARMQGLLNVVNYVLASGQVYHTPKFPAILLINGVREQRYFDLVFQPYFLRSDTTNPTGIFCAAYDITEQVRIQRELQEKEHRFRTIIEEASVATAVYIGEDLTIQYANAIMIGYWGKDASVIGNPLASAVPELEGQTMLRYLRHVYNTGEIYTGTEEEILFESGGQYQPYYYNYTYKPLRDKDGVTYGVHHMAVDVTEQVTARKRLEESRQELQLAIDVADLGTFRIDLRTGQTTYSKRIMDWFSLSNQSTHMDKAFTLVHPDDRPALISAIYAAAEAGGERRHNLTFRVTHPTSGATRYLHSFGETSFARDGSAVLLVGVIQDVTQQMMHQHNLQESEAKLQLKVLERTLELQKLNEELSRSNMNLEEFAYAASHDMKEPIRKIHFFSERLRQELEGKLSEEQARFFSRMEHASRRMSALIDDLLTFSHVSRGAVNFERIDLNDKIKLVLEDLELEIETEGASVEVGDLPMIQGQRRQVQQLFQNLIGNALKYHRPGEPPVVSITAVQVRGSESGRTLSAEENARLFHLIEVRDNGIGFPQEDAERIFQVFTRLHGNAEYKGNGVGLSIAQKVAQNHGGYLWAESSPGAGASFKILFPAE